VEKWETIVPQPFLYAGKNRAGRIAGDFSLAEAVLERDHTGKKTAAYQRLPF
jgi:hypothetical protein